jgi:hypothetical protein
LATVTSLLAIGCDGDPRPNRLDIAARTPAAESDDEWLRKQQLLRVKIENLDTNGNVVSTSEEDRTVAEAASFVRQSCQEFVGNFCPIPRNCQAKTFLALATPQSDPITLTGVSEQGVTQRFTFDQVTEANAAEFASLAIDLAQSSVQGGLQTLKNRPSVCRGTNGIGWGLSDSRNWAQIYATHVVEAYYLARAAYDRAFEATMNVADAARSSSASAIVAGKRVAVQPLFSRAAAAHLLVGGDDGLLGSTTAGYCAASLAPSERRALGLLRDAAPKPASILDQGLTIQDFLQKVGQNGESVRERLAALYEVKQFGWQGTTTLAAASQKVEEYYDLTEQDFVAAREYLKEEITVFNRSRSALLPPIRGISRYAGVAGDRVPELPISAWTARARFTSAVSPWYDIPGGFWRMAANGFNPGLVQNRRTPPLDMFIGETYSRIRELTRTATAGAYAANPPVSSTDQAEVLGVLNSIELGKEYLGAIEFSVPSTRASIRTVVHGFGLADKVRVVVGDDGLRCAVQGNIEGSDCRDTLGGALFGTTEPACLTKPSLSCLTVSIPSIVSSPGNAWFGTTGYVDGTRALSASIIDPLIQSKTRLYFVKLKDQNLPEEPGNYESLGGSTIRAGASSSVSWNVAFPIVPIVDRQVAQALAPSRKNCVENEVTCLGVSMDARLPLEDELTDDGNGFENSWRHYLNLARQAAEEAALLGREFRDAKLNKLQGDALAEQRQEEQRQAASSALQEVQNICGTDLDTSKLLDFLSRSAPAGADRNKLSSVLVPSCQGSNCVTDPAKLTPSDVSGSALDPAQLKRFQDCIDESPASIEPYVTLGDRPFCVWSRGNEVCPAGAPCFRDPPCTDLASSTKGIAKPLSYFVSSKAPADRSGGKACELLRKARGTPNSVTLSDLAATGVLNQDRLKDRLGQIGFRAEYGGFFTILEDKSPRFSSVHSTRGRSSGWPWTGQAPGCAGGGAGLFCTALTSTTVNDAAIGTFNARAFRAAYAAAAALGEDFYLIGPRTVKTDPAPCTGARETEYHLSNASAVHTATIPVWTCDPGYDSRMELKDGRAFQPRVTPPPLSWILPSGATQTGTWYLAGSTLKVEQQGRLTKDQAIQNTWAGLSRADMFPYIAGLVEDALSTGGSVPADVMFGGYGYDLNLMAVPGGRPGSVHWIMLDVASVLDGLELLCELDAKHENGSVTPGGTLDLSSVDAAGDAIRKLADTLSDQGSNIFFANVPKLAADSLGVAGPTGAFPALSAEMGEAVAGLRQAFIGTQHALPVMANALRSMSGELQTLRTQLEISSARKELVNYSTLSSVLNQVTACAESVGSPVKVWASAISCANSAAQIGIAFKQGSLQTSILDAEEQLARLAFIERMSQNATALEQAALGLAESREAVTMSLARIDGLKKRAKLAIARALYLSSYQSAAQVVYDNAVGSLESLARKRFDKALMNAKLMSFFAKRAIEQRLGVKLYELRQDFPLVDAPALWEAEACTYGGFQDLEDPNADPSASKDDWVAKYGKGFIGDYVTKLENFVESYRLAESFHEGKDTAVISLRDDVANVRAECTTPSRNLLKNAAELHSEPWAPRSCNPVVIGGVSVTGANCISAVARDISGVPDLAVPGLVGYQDSATGYKLQFGDGKDCVVADSGGCGWKPGSALSQIVYLSAGLYRLSWYTRDDKGATFTNGAKTDIVMIRPTGTLPVPAVGAFVNPADGSGVDWKRSTKEFTIAADGDYEIGFGVPTGTRPLATQPVTIGAPMLEAIVPGNSSALSAFEATDGDGIATIPACEDSEGKLFRLKRWTRECVRLCNDGFSANCETGPKHCYREFNFGVSQGALQSGRIFNYSGFAKGNFNYRIDSLGVNFVGSNIRNCEDSALPSTCYNAGFVPYSLEHNGPFFVRNRAGDDVPALLFDGRIEHARGLALERYFTSPISGTDRELLADFMRSEFSGRPLDGNFTLRVWEDQGFDFSSLQDVQLVLNYRYWTAFD